MSDDDSKKPLVIVDPDPLSRNAGEDIEDDLDRHVVALDATDFDLEASEEIMEAEAFIVCWDLGVLSGADLVESIRTDERLRDRVVIVATPVPTPSLVRTALRVGADSVCLQPYDAEQIRACLESAAARRADAESA